MGVGNYLAKILTETYGYQVLHVTEEFDLAGGVLDRNKAYDYARPYIEQILKENPSIEVVIDLHRDGVAEDRRLVTEINGKPTAQIMFFNGLSYTVSGGTVDYLPNPYIQDNLCFFFSDGIPGRAVLSGFLQGIYLSGLRYNLHLCKRSSSFWKRRSDKHGAGGKKCHGTLCRYSQQVLTGSEKLSSHYTE